MGVAGEPLQPHALFFQRAEEPLNQAVLLRHVRRDVLLSQPVVLTGFSEAPGLEHPSIVGADNRRRSSGTQRADPPNKLPPQTRIQYVAQLIAN